MKKTYKKYGDINEIEQHIPAWADADSIICGFNTTEELLNIGFVSCWKDHENFEYYAINEECLMAVGKNNTWWWVIGNIKKPSSVNLPNVTFDSGIAELIN
jgi:hypothetical protein